MKKIPDEMFSQNEDVNPCTNKYELKQSDVDPFSKGKTKRKRSDMFIKIPKETFFTNMKMSIHEQTMFEMKRDLKIKS